MDSFYDEGKEILETPIIMTGTAGSEVVLRPTDPTKDPNAVRWLFNPFMVIDLTNLPATCNMAFLENVVFNRVTGVDTYHAATDINGITGKFDTNGTSAAEYFTRKRTAYMIASELTFKHGDKGVVELTDLCAIDDHTPSVLNTLLFGRTIDCAFDIFNETRPVPNLFVLAETLQRNYSEFTGDKRQKELADKVVPVLRESIRTAQKYAQTLINEAQKRMLEEKNPNKTFNPSEQRAFLALGQEVPNRMPLVTKSAQYGATQEISQDMLNQAAIAGAVAATQLAQVPATKPTKKVEMVNA